MPASATVGDWVTFGIAQTGRLDQANGRAADTLHIVETCEAKAREAQARVERPWWKFW